MKNRAKLETRMIEEQAAGTVDGVPKPVWMLMLRVPGLDQEEAEAIIELVNSRRAAKREVAEETQELQAEVERLERSLAELERERAEVLARVAKMEEVMTDEEIAMARRLAGVDG